MKNINRNEKLSNWIKSLDSQIGDTKEEIEKRRLSLPNVVSMRDDIKCLSEYLKNNDLPESVSRALDYCLSWNPFTKKEE